MYLQSGFIIFLNQIPWTLLHNTKKTGPHRDKFSSPYATELCHKQFHLPFNSISTFNWSLISPVLQESVVLMHFIINVMHINTRTKSEWERDYYCSSEASQWDQHESWAFVYSNIEPTPVHQEHLCIPRSFTLLLNLNHILEHMLIFKVPSISDSWYFTCLLSVYIQTIHFGYVWFLGSNKEKNAKENGFLIFGFTMGNANENQI